jgi:hypothetical protein
MAFEHELGQKEGPRDKTSGRNPLPGESSPIRDYSHAPIHADSLPGHSHPT